MDDKLSNFKSSVLALALSCKSSHVWFAVILGDNSNQSADDSCDDDDSNSSYRRRMKNKRGIFPKSATGILKAWLFQNLAVSLYIAAGPDAGGVQGTLG